MTRTIPDVQRLKVLCWGQVWTPQLKGRRRVFGCLVAPGWEAEVCWPWPLKKSRDNSVLAPRSVCTEWFKDCWCITVLDLCCSTKWNFWSYSWFGSTNSCNTQHCKPNSHNISIVWLSTDRLISKSRSNCPAWAVKEPTELWLPVYFRQLNAFNYCSAGTGLEGRAIHL